MGYTVVRASCATAPARGRSVSSRESDDTFADDVRRLLVGRRVVEAVEDFHG
jgi:hypothetical protein